MSSTLTRRKTSSKETEKYSEPDIENAKMKYEKPKKVGPKSHVTKLNIFLTALATILILTLRSIEGFSFKEELMTSRLFSSYMTTVYGEDKYNMLLSHFELTPVIGRKTKIAEVKAKTSATPISDVIETTKGKSKPKPAPSGGKKKTKIAEVKAEEKSEPKPAPVKKEENISEKETKPAPVKKEIAEVKEETLEMPIAKVTKTMEEKPEPKPAPADVKETKITEVEVEKTKEKSEPKPAPVKEEDNISKKETKPAPVKKEENVPKKETKPAPVEKEENIPKKEIETKHFCPDCIYDSSSTMGDVTCGARAGFFVKKYKLSIEESKAAVLESQPNCASRYL